MAIRFLERSDLKERGVRFCNKHLLTLERKGDFPKRVRIGENRVAWVEHEIDHWQERVAAAREPASA